MSNLFLILVLVSFGALIAGLINPAWLRMPSRKRASLVAGGAFVLFFILFGVTMPPVPKNTEVAVIEQSTATATPATPVPKTEPATQPTANAQKDLSEFMALAKTAKVVSSYEFSDRAAVVYVDSLWYSFTVIQKKDFMAKIALLKKDVTGYKHFEVRDAYTDEKVGEVTSFSGSLEVYK